MRGPWDAAWVIALEREVCACVSYPAILVQDTLCVTCEKEARSKTRVGNAERE